MAASRLSRIAGCRLTLLFCLMTIALAGVSTDTIPTEHIVDDVELITMPRGGNDEFVAITGPEGDDKLGTSSSDLKKNSLNKKFQKFYPKTEADWNFKGEGKKTDVFIKDPKDHRLLRIISEGLLRPQDVLPIVPNDAITSSQKNVAAGSNEEMSVNVQPEGMSGVVNDGIAVDSDEKIIIEKKINASVERFQPKIEFDVSTESDESVNINLDANVGVQSPTFHKQKGSITVPIQKQITLSKGKESNHLHKKSHETSTVNGAGNNNGASNNFDVISLTKQKTKNTPIDEGVFDFVDSPLSDKHLVSAGTAQTSRINVKKGPNGQDYEYEYIYYYYEDPDEAAAGQTKAEKGQKGNEIPSSTGGPNLRTTTSSIRTSPTPSNSFTKSAFTEESIVTRVKTSDLLNEPNAVPQSTTSRDKFRNDFRYTIDNSVIFPPQTSIDSNKNVASNEVFWNYDASRLPGRQAQQQQPISQQSFHEHSIPPQQPISQQSFHEHSIPHQPITQQTYHEHSIPQLHHISQQSFVQQSTIGQAQEITTTVKPSRGRVHYNPTKTTTTTTTETTEENEFVVNTVPISTAQPPRETQSSRGKSTSGTIRQPGLELVDNNSFRTHSTNVPNNFETNYSPAQTFDISRGNKLHKQTAQQEFSTLPQNSLPVVGPVSSTNSWNIQDIFRKEQTNEYITGTERSSPPSTSARNTPSLVTETIVDNTAPISTLSDNSLTTVYGPGLTDKAAHDLYAIYQQTQNEETVRNTIAQDDRTTIVDEPTHSFVPQTNHPTTRIFATSILTTTPTTTTITTTTTTQPPPPPTTIFVSPPSSVPVHTRGRFRGTNTRARLPSSSTEAINPIDGAIPESTSERVRKFQPSARREPNRISAYGRRGSTTTLAPGEEGSSTVAQESSRPSFHPGSSRNRFRSTTVKQEISAPESQSTSARPNFADRYSSRRRPAFRASTTTVTTVDEANTSKHNAPETETIADQQSSTHRSIRNRFNSNSSRPKPLRPETKLNFAGRGRFGATSPPTSVSVPLDADTSGSADVPVEQKQVEENGEHQIDGLNETTLGSTFSTTPSTTTSSDTFSRLKHRPKLRISDKGSHAKTQAQQLNNTLSLNQNRRNLVHNLLPRKKQLHASTEGVHEAKEEKLEIAPRPVTEETEDDAPQPKQGDVEIAESQPAVEEVPSSTTTEHTNNKLSSLLASRRHNLANRKPGTFQRANKQTAATTEES